MEKLKPTLKNMTLVLVGVAVVVGFILAYVNHVTEGPIAEKAKATLAQGIKDVMKVDGIQVTKEDTVKTNVDGKDLTYIVHETSDKSGKPVGAAVESTTTGFGGDLKVLVGFDHDGKITGYTILESSETPGLGAKAEKWFQSTADGGKGGKSCVIGLSPKDGELKVSKDGGQVDAITASTITSRAFLKAINEAYAAYCKQNTDGTSGASKQENKKG
ncbi:MULTISPECIES: RnfABCDGE type electron transport complex subunit G [Prevotella]|uniref:Ion-translocating oxidoreductase complex subunit G n=1 Tax=Prevotella lacticifex TaxID=2854755 RepID=A0A9R1CX68_9BACT|nr:MULTISPECIES: RnfABCDGE type electron transport complex subunit G [Prevotella]MDD6854504.1 RnfABCDGE type electron transport complex subunit G [Prevotella sp.]GJG35924.1 electron transport complex subunit G [Prevotella lacticifex]GJG39026.1 electron transport complex subunit G [Prevotella lacticifex]GJG42293.1 electron transport complex subunit G [Prevotella lacticifex]GJG45381.1 electron transport complex subunit G [Prevotella lacticifex]